MMKITKECYNSPWLRFDFEWSVSHLGEIPSDYLMTSWRDFGYNRWIPS